MKTYLYEITSSAVDTVKVGTFIVDRSDETSHRGEPRTWHLYRPGGGITVGWSGVLLHRVCGPCRDMDYVREHGHNGRHGEYGEEPQLTPRRLDPAPAGQEG